MLHLTWHKVKKKIKPPSRNSPPRTAAFNLRQRLITHHFAYKTTFCVLWPWNISGNISQNYSPIRRASLCALNLIPIENPANKAYVLNPLNPELNPICYLLALIGAHHFLHVSRIRVKLLTLRRLMSCIYIYIHGAPILDVSRSHTTTQHSR